MSPVRGLARFFMTGVRSISSGLSASMARLRSCPRPAKASPKPARFVWIAARVRASKVLSTSSISTGSGVALRTGMVAPSSKPWRFVPFVSSTYFRPSAERERMTTVVSTGSGLIVVSSFSVRSAETLPPASLRGSIFVTAPTRVPPRRTSLPTTRLAALGTWALRV